MTTTTPTAETLATAAAHAAIEQGGSSPFDSDGNCLLPAEASDADTVALTSVGVAKLEGVAVAVAREAGAVAPTLHERIAKALGWTLRDTQSFSLQTLRVVVRPVSPKLAAELDEAIRSGRYITGA